MKELYFATTYFKKKFITILALILLMTVSGKVNAQVTVTACSGGIYSVTNAAVYGFPPGLSADLKGMWSATPSLTFSQPTIFQTIISGFSPNTLYTVTWRSAKNNKDYVFRIQTGAAVAQSGTLLVNNGGWNTNDIVYCSGSTVNYPFQITGANLTNYEFWRTVDATGSPVIFGPNSTNNTATLSTYASQDVIWGIATDNNGCQSYTNSIRMAAMTSTEVVVVGGMSVCGTTVPAGIVLQVQPYNSSGLYSYQWRVNTGSGPAPIAGATSSTYTVSSFGKYDVVVSGPCVPATFTTNAIDVNNTVLPDVTVTGDNEICAGSSTILTANHAAATVNYQWLYGGLQDVALGTFSTASASGAGVYQAKIVSTTNPDCYKVSNGFDLEFTTITATLAKGNNLTPFCAADASASRTPVIVMNFTGGTAPYSVVLSANGTNLPARSVSSGVAFSMSPISTTTSYSVVSVTDATGCTMDATTFPSPITFNVLAVPTVQSLISTSNVCEGTAMSIGLQNSEAGVTYTLRKNVSGVVTDVESITQAATGTFSFTTQPSTIGTYYVVARNGASCPEVTMNGTRQILPAPTVFDMGILQTTPYCAGNNYNFTLSGSQTGVNYTLNREGVAVETMAGTGLPLTFSAVTTTGTYSITASNGACSVVTMNNIAGQNVISLSPTTFAVTGGNGCSNTGVNIGLSNSTAGIRYDLFLNSGSGAGFVTSVTSVGGPFSFGTYASAGTYTVVGVNATTLCSTNMTGTVVITDIPNDIPLLNTGSVCDYGTVELQNSQTGVSYQLQRDGANIGNAINGTGTAISFGSQGTAGIYTVVAQYTASGCARTLSNTLEIQEYPVTYTLSANKTSYCAGASPTGIVLALSNSETGVSYQLYNSSGAYGGALSGSTGNSITWSNIPAGSYYVRAQSSAGCLTQMNGNPVISINPLPSASIAVQGANGKCSGAPGTFTIAVSLTGTPPFNFTVSDDKGVNYPVVGWATNIYTMSVNPSATTTYTVSNVSDNGGCQGTTTGAAVININPVPTVTITGSTSICLGQTTTLTADGAGAGGTYLWSTGANSAAITVAPTNTITPTPYDVIVTTALGCTSNATVNVRVNALPTVSFTGFATPATYCANEPRVQLTGLPALGGTYTGNGIIGTEFDPSMANTGPNMIYYTYTDGNGCTNISPAQTVYVNPLPVVNIIELPRNYCANQGATTFTGIPTSGDGVFSILTPGAAWGDNNDGTAWFNPSASVPGTSYNVRYTFTDGNGCVNYIDEVATIIQDITNGVTITGINPPFCQDDATGHVLHGQYNGVNVTGTFTGPNPGLVDNGGGVATFTPSLAGNGTHTISFTYTDPVTGCSGTRSVTVTIGTVLSQTLAALYCNDDANTYTLDGTPDGGFWTVTDPSGTVIGTNINDNTPWWKPGSANPTTGVYHFRYDYNDGSCLNSRTWDVTLVDDPDASFTTGTTPAGITKFCYDDNGPISLVPVQSGGFFTGDGVTGYNFNPSSTTVGWHTITYTINAGICYDQKTLNVEVVAAPVIDIANLNASYCDNEATVPIQGSVAGIGAVTSGVFDSELNTSGIPLVIDKGNGTAELNPAVGKGTYWVSYTYTSVLTNCPATIYKTVVIHESDPVNFGGLANLLQYCSSDSPVTLTANFTSGVPTGSGNFVLSAGILPAGAFTDNGDGTATFNPSLIPIGTYNITYTYTNANGCVTARTKQIQFLSAPIIYNVTGGGHICSYDAVGLPIGLSDSETGVTYELLRKGIGTGITLPGDDGPLSFVPQTIGGEYTIEATNDATGCKALMNSSAEIVVNNITVAVATTDVSCRGGNNGEIILTGSSSPGQSLPYLYTIDGGVSWDAGNTFSGLSQGTYQVNIKDLIGCTIPANQTVVINEPATNMVVTDPVITDVGCMPCTVAGTCEGEASVTVSGGSPYSNLATYPSGYKVEWRDATNAVIGNALTLSQVAPGTYTVYISDANNCTATPKVAVVGTKPAITLSWVSQTNNICHGGNNGTLKVQAVGGTGVFQFSIDNSNWYDEDALANDTYTFKNLIAGTYTVYVRDKNYLRCPGNVTITAIITEPTAIVTTLVNKDNVSCYGVADGQFTVSASGGASGVYRYSIDGVDFTNNTGVFSSLSPNSYKVFVKDDVNGCISTDLPLVVIDEPAELTVTAQNNKNVSCQGGNDGQITALPAGGNGGYIYSWTKTGDLTFVATTAVVTGVGAGSYVVTVTDSKGCTAFSLPVVVTEPAVTLDFDVVNVVPVSCNCTLLGACDGSASIIVHNAVTPFTVLWSSGGTALTESGLAPGTYSVTVTDANGCTLSKSVNVGMMAPIVVTEDLSQHVDVSCNGGSNGQFVVSATGGSGNYEFTIDGSTWVSNPLFKNLSAQSYTVQVRDLLHPTCIYTIANDVVIDEPLSLSLSELLSSHHYATCYNANDGVLQVVASGGSAVYEYSIDGGSNWQSSSYFGTLVGGTYSVWVRDANEITCVYSGMAPITIDEPKPINFTYVKTDISCFGANNGTIVVTPTAGGGNSASSYSYSIDNGTTWVLNNTFIGLLPGNYQVLIRDDQSTTGCWSPMQTVTISEPSQIGASLVAGSQVNVKCHGDNTGAFKVAPIPADASLEYSIDGGTTWKTSVYFTGLTAGTYYVSVQNGSCRVDNVLSVIITEPSVSLSFTSETITNVTCSSNSSTGNVDNGTIAVVVAGGTTPYSYQWLNTDNGNAVSAVNGGNTATAINLTEGNYVVNMLDANNCPISKNYSISQPVDWNVSHTSTNVTVAGGNDGTITITSIAGATAPYLITWADGAAYNGLSARNNLTKGTYTYTITDASGCKYTKTIEIFDTNALSVTFNKWPVLCYGDLTGHVDVTVGNGTPPYNLTWTALTATNKTPSGSSNNIPVVYHLDNLEAGTYTLEVTDATGAKVTEVVVVSQPSSPLTMAVSVSNLTCNGTNDGTIDVRPAGGTPWITGEYDIAIIPGSTVHLSSNLFKNLNPGAYIINVVDENGCSASQNETIYQPDPLVVSFNKTNVDCHGASTGSLTAIVTGRSAGTAFNYDWYTVNIAGVETAYSLNGPATITNLPAGTYRVKITTGSCNVSGDVVISENAAIQVSAVVTDVTSCQGDATGKIDLNLSGGVTPYLVQYQDGGAMVTKTVNSTTYSITGLLASSYQITVSDFKGCTYPVIPVVVNEPNALQLTDLLTTIDCETTSTGTLSFNIKGGQVVGGNHRYSVVIAGPSGFTVSQTITAISGAISPVSYTGLNAGNYTISLKDALSTSSTQCEITQSFTLSHIVIDGVLSDPTCKGVNNGSVTNISIKGAEPGYTYTWSYLSGGSGLDFTTLPQAGLSAGTYRLSVFEPIRNCTVYKDFVLTDQRIPAVDAAVKDVECNGGITGAITAVVVTDITNGIYTWTGPGIINPNAIEQTALGAGTYQLDVTDNVGCIATKTFNVNEPSAISYDLSSALVDCEPHTHNIALNNLVGGTAPTGNYKFFWQGPGMTANTQNLTGLTTGGTYTVTVRDINNCELKKSIYLTSSITLDTTVVRPVCAGGTDGSITVVVNGGSGNFNYIWSRNGVVMSGVNVPNVSNIGAGNYRLTVTDLTESISGVNCSASIDVVIIDKPVLAINESITNLKCFGDSNGAIDITVMGGTAPYTYSWSGANVSVNAQDQVNLKGGTYSVTVTDVLGCQVFESFTINEPAALTFNLNVTQTDCDGNNGTISVVNVVGGTMFSKLPFYKYQWAGQGALPVDTITTSQSSLSHGRYYIHVSDKNGCSLTKDTALISPLVVTAVPKPQTCGNTADGEIDITVTGGVAPYFYNWTTVDGGNLIAANGDQVGLIAGNYRVVVTDSRTPAACSKTLADIIVGRQSQLVVSGKAYPVLCYGAKTGRINLSVTGGSGNYKYSWTGPDLFSSSSEDIQNLAKGNYQVIIEDLSTGCIELKSFVIDGPDAPLVIDNITSTDVDCYGDFSGTINVTASGGSPYGTAPNEFYRYLWTGPVALDSVAVHNQLPAGNYTVIAKDVNGCLSSASAVVISQPVAPLNLSLVEILNVTIPGGINGAVEVDVIGGTGNYTYTWYSCDKNGANQVALSQTSSRIDNLTTGYYMVVVQDEKGCSITSKIYAVTEPGQALQILVSDTQNIHPCYGTNNGVIAFDVIGGNPDMTSGTAQYTIQFYKNGVLESSTIGNSLKKVGLSAGYYEIVVTDNSNVVARQSITLTEPTALMLLFDQMTPASCYQGSNGQIRVYVSGGAPAAGGLYQLTISGPEGTKQVTVPAGFYSFTNLSAGNHKITVVDDVSQDGIYNANDPVTGDCSILLSDIEVTQPEAHVVLTGDVIVCDGVQATLKLVTTNWTNIAASPLTVTLSNGTVLTVNSTPFLHTFTPLVSDVVEIQSVEVGGCSKGTFEGAAVIDFKERPDAHILGRNTICAGETTELVFDLVGMAPWSITYNNGTTDIVATNILSTPYKVVVSPVVTTTYALKSVTDNNCSKSFDPSLAINRALVTVNAIPTVTMSGNNTICEGTSTNLTFNLTGKAPWQITYTVGGVEQVIPDIMSSPYVLAVNPVITTTYSLVQLRDANGCEQDVSGSVLVTVKPKPGNPGLIYGNLQVCQGKNGFTYEINAVTNDPGNTYEWEVPAGFTIASGQGSAKITVNVGTTAANGVVKVTVKNNCGNSIQSAEKYITVNPLPDKPGNISGSPSICQGTQGLIYSVAATANATSYIWSVPAGLNIISGNGTTTIVVNTDPAQASVTGNITVKAVNDCGEGVISNPLSVTINPLPAVNAGNDESICSSSYTMKATNPGIGFSGSWSVKSGAATFTSIGSFSSQVTNIAKGENVFVWTVVNASTGCTFSDEVKITNNQLVVNASANVYESCDGTAVLYGTNFDAGTTALWSFDTGSGSISNATAAQTTVTGLSSGTVILRYTLTKNGCSSSATVTIVNNKPTDAVVSNSGAVADVCGSTVQLIALAPGANNSGQWNLMSGAGVFDNVNNSTVNITGLQKNTDNKFQWIVTRGNCRDIVDVTVRNNQIDVEAGADQKLCTKTATLDATLPSQSLSGNVSWSIAKDVNNNSLGSGSFDNATKPNATVSNLGFGDNHFVWEVNQRGCYSRDTVVITSNQPTTAEILTGNISNCADTALLQAVVSGSLNGIGYWSVVGGSGDIDNKYNPVTVVRHLGIGNNTLRWTVTEAGCFSTAEIIVTNKHVAVDAGKDFAVCDNFGTLNAIPAPTGLVGEWTVVPGLGSGSFSPDSNNPKATVYGLSSRTDAQNNVIRTNTFRWTVTNDGCATSDDVVVTYNSVNLPEAGVSTTINNPTYKLGASKLVSGEVGTWSIVAGAGSFVDIHDPLTIVNNLQQGPNVFRWTVEYGGCSRYAEVTITNGQVTKADAGTAQSVCLSEVELHANSAGVGLGEWSVVQGFGSFVDIRDPRTKVKNLGAGVNIFRWTIYYTGSSSSATVAITNNTPTKANAGRDIINCRDWHQMEGNVPTVGTAKWTIITGGGIIDDSTLPNAKITGMAQGNNVFKYEISNMGCSSIDSVKIVNGLPTQPDAGADQTLCVDSVLLMPNNPTFGVGEWQIAEGFAEISGNWAKKMASGTNRLSWVITTAQGCTLSDTVVVVNNKPTTAFSGYDTPTCSDSIKLLGNTPEQGIGTWQRITGSGSIDDVNSPYTMVHGLGRGSNRFRWVIDNNGCKSSDDVSINNNLIVAVAGYDQTLCADTALLSANTAYPGVGTWGILAGTQKAEFDDPDNPYTTVRKLDQGTNILTWTIVNNGCTSVSQVSIVNNNPTAANAGQDVNTCNNFVTLSANNPSQGSGTWTIRNGGGSFSSMTSHTASVTDLSVGSNIFRWTIENNGCVTYDDVEVSANTIVAEVGPDQTNLCSNTTVLQANNASPGVGTWSVGGGGVSQANFADVNNPNTTVSNLGRGQNTLRWTIVNQGCVSYKEMLVVNNSPSTAYAGNARELCIDNVTLDATPVEVGVGHWEVLTGSASVADVNNPHTAVTKLSQGDNLFRWSVVNGTCIDADEVLIVNNHPSKPYAGADEELCSSNYQLKAGIPEFGSGLWSIIKGSGNIEQPEKPESSISNIGMGENIYLWTITKGQCQLTDSVVLINNTPAQAQAGPDIQDCKNYAELDANIPSTGYGTGKWTLISGKGDFTDDTNAKTTVNNLGFGENILLWTISKGSCFSSDKISVFNKVPDQAAAGNDRTICENYIVLNANNPNSGSGKWTVLSGAGDFEDATRFDTKVNNVGFGENQYKWTISYGTCVTEDLVKVNSNKAYPYAGEDDVIYMPDYSLRAANPGDLAGKWTLLGGKGSFENDVFFNTKVSGLNQGVNTFRWTIDVNGCVAYDDVSITYKLIPDAGFVVDTAKGCYPLTVQFTNYSVGGTVYNWDFGDGQLSGERNPKHVYTQPGEYIAVLTVPGPDGQDDVFSQRIVVYEHPTAEFNVAPNTVYVPGDAVRCYNLSAGGRSYLWDFGDGATSVEVSPLHDYTKEGVYDVSLLVTNQFGCTDEFTIYNAVSVLQQGFIVFPNAFAPRPEVSNGGENVSAANQVFKPKYKDVDVYHIQIFDRWGQLIYESDDISQGWDGMYKNQMSAQDVYVYKAWGKFISGKEFRVTGNVLLVR
jgi:gliding motility-associated-like protein